MSTKYKWIYQKEYANINQLILAHIKQKWICICLVDEELELPKYKIIGEDIEQIVIEYFADGKRYKDICDILKDAGLTTMDVHRIFEKHKVLMKM